MEVVAPLAVSPPMIIKAPRVGSAVVVLDIVVVVVGVGVVVLGLVDV